MCLDGTEFVRRFLLHVLLDGLVKIRYFGYMAHRNRKNEGAYDEKFFKTETQSLLERLGRFDIYCTDYCHIL